MVFSSIPFLFFFLPIFFILYYVVPTKWRNIVLLIFSLIFYAWGEPVYIGLMILVTLSDYISGRVMIRIRRPKICLIYSVIFDLLILSFFKYANFLISTINGIAGLDIKALNLSLPVGISFFTFQSLSYIFDLYRKDTKEESSYLRYLTYVSMFPQLVAGPIVRYSTVATELKERKCSREDFSEGVVRLLNGLFKKVLLANQIGMLWEDAAALMPGERTLLVTWMGAVAFTFQIYFDFSGYSDMAIGMGIMLGFHFDENFNEPLMANSITDFWRRWHISLSGWFKSYVYIPLGGNRAGALKQVRNIMIVWMLTGLWHGASWNFVLWGLYYGVLLLVEKFFLNRYMVKWPEVLRHIYAFVIVVIGFVIFALDDFSALGQFLASLIGINCASFSALQVFWYIRNYGIIIVLCAVFSGIIPKRWRLFISEHFMVLKPVVYVALLLLSIASLVNDSYNPFLYFRF